MSAGGNAEPAAEQVTPQPEAAAGGTMMQRNSSTMEGIMDKLQSDLPTSTATVLLVSLIFGNVFMFALQVGSRYISGTEGETFQNLVLIVCWIVAIARNAWIIVHLKACHPAEMRSGYDLPSLACGRGPCMDASTRAPAHQ